MENIEALKSAMEAILAVIGTFFTQTLTWLGSFITFVVSQPILLLGLAMMVVGFVVSIYRRITSAV